MLKDIQLLEAVQRRASKWILNGYISDYKSRLHYIHLLPLMMTLELYDISFSQIFLLLLMHAFNVFNYVSFNVLVHLTPV